MRVYLRNRQNDSLNLPQFIYVKSNEVNFHEILSIFVKNATKMLSILKLFISHTHNVCRFYNRTGSDTKSTRRNTGAGTCGNSVKTTGYTKCRVQGFGPNVNQMCYTFDDF